MKKDSFIINMDDPAAKRRLMIEIGRLSGLYEVYIKPRHRTRTLDQNSFYWAAVVQPFTEWLQEVWGDKSIDKEQAHEMLKVKILGLQKKQMPGTNETVTIIPHSKTLGTEEFATYVEKCIAWLGEFCQIVVLPSELFYERPTPQMKEKRIDF